MNCIKDTVEVYALNAIMSMGKMKIGIQFERRLLADCCRWEKVSSRPNPGVALFHIARLEGLDAGACIGLFLVHRDRLLVGYDC